MTWREMVERLEWQYRIVGSWEGKMCPVCSQRPPRELTKRTPAYIRKMYGHTPRCWLGNAIAAKRRPAWKDAAKRIKQYE
jgi:hypothetical protein